MCESLRLKNCYFSTAECKNKNLYVLKIRVNLNEAVNDVNIDQVANIMRIEVDSKSLN